MSFVSEVYDYEEIMEHYKEIKNILQHRPDLLNVFMTLVHSSDMNYITESSEEESSDSDIDDLSDEDNFIIEDDDGFLSIA